MERGRPKIDDPKAKRIEIRMTEDQLKDLNDCAKELNTTRTEVIMIGVNLVKEMLHENK